MSSSLVWASRATCPKGTVRYGAQASVIHRPQLPPTPPASDESTRRAMKGNRRADTAPEIAVRRILHARGRRFRKDYRVTGVHDLSVRADIVFSRQRIAVFVDGCFWHGCPDHCRVPKRNRPYWIAKIERNRVRDERIRKSLATAGWRVVQIWEHEQLETAVARIESALSGGVRTFGS